MQIEPDGAPADPAVILAAAGAADDDEALGYEAALPFLVPSAPALDDPADAASAVC